MGRTFAVSRFGLHWRRGYPAVPAVRAAATGSRLASNVGDTAAADPVTPDFNTPVDTASHELRTAKRWSGLQGLRERTRGTLIDDTLQEMEASAEFTRTAADLKRLGQKRLTLKEKKARRRALDNLGVPDFRTFLKQNNASVVRVPTDTMQLNIGLYCNQACVHCHVESSPKRKEMMSREVADRCLELLANSPGIKTVDITGGAPEMNAEFRHIVTGATQLGRQVIDRCNLTVLSEPDQEDLVPFLAEHNVRVVASLPCYTLDNVDKQRGRGVFDKSIDALARLNEAGYGLEGSSLGLDLVYNPLGAFLPPEQGALQEKYKEELRDTFGIDFHSLFTLTNMPIKRFADFLSQRGELEPYLDLLVRNFNPETTTGAMCTNHISVDWQGRIFDCDFNQQLDLPLRGDGDAEGLTVFDIECADDVYDKAIVHDNHCFGCVAGMGSS